MQRVRAVSGIGWHAIACLTRLLDDPTKSWFPWPQTEYFGAVVVLYRQFEAMQNILFRLWTTVCRSSTLFEIDGKILWKRLRWLLWDLDPRNCYCKPEPSCIMWISSTMGSLTMDVWSNSKMQCFIQYLQRAICQNVVLVSPFFSDFNHLSI